MTNQISEKNKVTGSYKIRPAGRHLATIGKELIQNEAAAIIELVKNAYDADADAIYVEIKLNNKNKAVEIIITDNGEMSFFNSNSKLRILSLVHVSKYSSPP